MATIFFNALYSFGAFVLLQKRNCPFCNSSNFALIYKTGVFSRVFRCKGCNLMYRWPKQGALYNRFFYRFMYSFAHKSMASLMPDSKTLQELIKSNFAGTEKDASLFFDIISLLGSNTSIFDYGCSWGYFLSQAISRGFKASGFEISTERATFGQQALGLTIFSNLDKVTRGLKVDIMYSSHVLEHVSNLQEAASFFQYVVKKDGWIILRFPNCGGKSAKLLGPSWGPFSSFVHPLSLDKDFTINFLGKIGVSRKLFFSSPYDLGRIKHCLSRENDFFDCLEGDELLVLATKS
jgi:hypothetical protein